MVFDQVAHRLHELELVSEQLGWRDVLHLRDKVRGRRHERGIGVGERLGAAEDDEMLAADGNQHGVLGPVRTDDAGRLVAIHVCGPARAVDPRRERLLVEQQIHDAAPSFAAAAAADEAQPVVGDMEDQRVHGHAWRFLPFL
ncbi:MAG: hypothetical protein ABSC35_12660 [Candidatus Dormibacteria bacterium]